MSDLHIDDFYKDTGKIFISLYRSFPRKSLLFIEDISGSDTPDEYGLHSERHQSCFATATWLAEAGYLHYSEAVRQEALDQAVLSHKAFTLLSARSDFTPTPKEDLELPPSIRESQSTNIHLLRNAIKDGSSANIRQMIQYLLVQSKKFF